MGGGEWLGGHGDLPHLTLPGEEIERRLGRALLECYELGQQLAGIQRERNEALDGAAHLIDQCERLRAEIATMRAEALKHERAKAAMRRGLVRLSEPWGMTPTAVSGEALRALREAGYAGNVHGTRGARA